MLSFHFSVMAIISRGLLGLSTSIVLVGLNLPHCLFSKVQYSGDFKRGQPFNRIFNSATLLCQTCDIMQQRLRNNNFMIMEKLRFKFIQKWILPKIIEKLALIMIPIIIVLLSLYGMFAKLDRNEMKRYLIEVVLPLKCENLQDLEISVRRMLIRS